MASKRERPRAKDSAVYRPAAIFVAVCAVLVVIWISLGSRSEAELRRRLAEVQKSAEPERAEEVWERLAADYPDRISPEDQTAWVRASLIADHPSRAFHRLEALRESGSLSTDGWLMLIELKRVLGDADGVAETVEDMLQHPEPRKSLPVLMAATFGILTDMEPEDSRKRLERWAKAEPDAPLAQAWLTSRSMDSSFDSRSSSDEILAQSRVLAERFPESVDAVRVFAEVLLERGDYPEVVRALERWPKGQRSGIGWMRLEGRRLLEIDKDPAGAVRAFREVLNRAPHDWKTRFRLSRALSGAGETEAAKEEARKTAEIRELLDPAGLQKILKSAFPKGVEPNTAELIVLLRRIGQTELASAWQERAELDAMIRKVPVLSK